jgi:carbon monoxide dehydrogenase subunit G
MASIRKEVVIDVPPDEVWAAVRDVGAVHTRLAAGFVTDCRMDGDARIVTFANGMVVREPIVDINDADRRLVWSAEGGRLTHYNGAAQVFDAGAGRTRFVWVADLLPNEMAPAVEGMLEQGMTAIKKTQEGIAKTAADSSGR